ncbi:MAG: hypothetical protein J0M18_17585 [Ignavibacteria bacterium]|nr:hypothetical protein [Ignavibacteria bacterium]
MNEIICRFNVGSKPINCRIEVIRAPKPKKNKKNPGTKISSKNIISAITNQNIFPSTNSISFQY